MVGIGFGASLIEVLIFVNVAHGCSCPYVSEFLQSIFRTHLEVSLNPLNRYVPDKPIINLIINGRY